MVLKSRFVAGMLFILAQVAAAQPASWEDRLVGSGRWGWTYYDDNPIYSVAISGDGATVVVGGTGDGAARVFERSAGAWSQQASLPLPSDAVGPSWDAFSAAISADGNTVLVGDPGDDGLTGAAWVYTRSGGAWAQQGPKLVGSGAVGFVYQGLSVAISADGNTAVVGGPWDIGGAGVAWVYTRSGGVWSQQAKLVGASPARSRFRHLGGGLGGRQHRDRRRAERRRRDRRCVGLYPLRRRVVAPAEAVRQRRRRRLGGPGAHRWRCRPMATPRSSGGHGTTSSRARHGCSPGRTECGRSRGRSLSALVPWGRLGRAARWRSPRMATAPSSAGRGTTGRRAQRGSSRARAQPGRS